MPDEPISNPGVSRIEPTPNYGPEKPSLAGQETERPFTLGPEGGEKVGTEPSAQRPSPMEVAGDAARQQAPIPPEELQHQIQNLNQRLGTIQQSLQNTDMTKNFSSDHYEALRKVTQKMNPDFKMIADNSKGKFEPAQQKQGQDVVGHVVDWLNGAQGTLGGALDFLQTTGKPDITSYLRLQYAVQRATQRGELFASIVGSSVSGIKTIMSTQLG